MFFNSVYNSLSRPALGHFCDCANEKDLVTLHSTDIKYTLKCHTFIQSLGGGMNMELFRFNTQVNDLFAFLLLTSSFCVRTKRQALKEEA